MLREARKYIEDTFVKYTTYAGAFCYEKRFTGNWKIYLNMSDNETYIMMDSKYTNGLFDKNKSSEFKREIVRIFVKEFNEIMKFIKHTKTKPKRMNLKEIATLVNVIKSFDEHTGFLIKELQNKYKLIELEKDF